MSWRYLAALIPLTLHATPSIGFSLTADVSHLQSPSVTADRTGNIVIAGRALDCTLPAVKAFSQCGALWVAKLDGVSGAILFATYIGTPKAGAPDGFVGVTDVRTDSDGNIIVAGVTFTSVLPAVNAIQSAVKGNGNTYVLKVAADGSKLLYSTYIGGSNYDLPVSMALDSSGAAYVLITTNSADFPVTAGAVYSSSYGRSAIVKIPAAGGALVYSATFDWVYTSTPLQVNPSNAAVLVTDSQTLKVSPDGSALQRTALPQWAQGAYPWLSPAADGSYWLSGSVTNGTLPVTANAFQPISGRVPYARIEFGNISQLAHPIIAHQTYEFAVDPFERFRIYAATDNGVYRSEDNGWDWYQLLPTPTRSIAVDPFDQNTLYAAITPRSSTDPPLYRSTDRGATWTPVPVNAGKGVTIDSGIGFGSGLASLSPDPTTQGRLYAVAPYTAFRIKNGGQQWVPLALPQPAYMPGGSPSSQSYTRASVIHVDPSNANRVYTLATTTCLGFCPYLQNIYRSDDAGATIASAGSIGLGAAADMAIDSSSGDIFVVSSGALTVYRGGDLTTRQILLPSNVSAMSLDPEQPGAVYITMTDQTIQRSGDGGQTWSTIVKTPALAPRIIIGDGGVIHVAQMAITTDAFAFRYDASGTLTYGTYLGGGATTASTAVVAPNGHLLVAGSTGAGFPVVSGAQSGFGGGDSDGFVAEFDAGGTLISSTYLGGSGADKVTSIVPLPDGSVVAFGTTSSTDFPVTQTSALGTGTLFAVRIRP